MCLITPRKNNRLSDIKRWMQTPTSITMISTRIFYVYEISLKWVEVFPKIIFRSLDLYCSLWIWDNYSCCEHSSTVETFRAAVAQTPWREKIRTTLKAKKFSTGFLFTAFIAKNFHPAAYSQGCYFVGPDCVDQFIGGLTSPIHLYRKGAAVGHDVSISHVENLISPIKVQFHPLCKEIQPYLKQSEDFKNLESITFAEFSVNNWDYRWIEEVFYVLWE